MTVCVDSKSRTQTATCCSSVDLVHEHRLSRDASRRVSVRVASGRARRTEARRRASVLRLLLPATDRHRCRTTGAFLQLHLRGLRGRDDVLKATTIQALHGRVARRRAANCPLSPLPEVRMPRVGLRSRVTDEHRSNVHGSRSTACRPAERVPGERARFVGVRSDVRARKECRTASRRPLPGIAVRHIRLASPSAEARGSPGRPGCGP